MPEAPEVKRMAVQVQNFVEGKSLSAVQILAGRYQRHPETWKALPALPKTITEVGCKGKFIYWKLDQDWYCWITLGMTASFALAENAYRKIRFSFSDGMGLYYDDIRNFGTVAFYQDQSKLIKRLSELGPDPLQSNFDLAAFKKNLTKQGKKPIGYVLMDPKVISGVGNYLRCEILYAARISPYRLCSDLTSDDVERLAEVTIDTVQRSYSAGGATLATYRDMIGQVGSFTSQLQVYGKKSDPLGNVVKREVGKNGRTVWWVPMIQK